MLSRVPRRCDVVVIGGGPAGSTAAAFLAQKGYDVVLLEKARHPRPIVGESLIPHFWKYCDRIGVSDRIATEGFVAKGGGLSLWNGVLRRLSFRDFGYERPGLHVERDVFDALLLRRSAELGARVFQQIGVARVQLADGGPSCVRYRGTRNGEVGEIETRFVVDASGQAAIVARQLGIRRFDEALKFMSLWGYYRGGHYVTLDGEVLPFEQRFERPPATLTSNIGGWGWTWHIVLRDCVSVGVVLPPDRLEAFRASSDTLEAKFRGLVAATPFTRRLLKDAEFLTGSLNGIRDYAYKPTRLAIGNCFLVGDAAAFVDPINSAGVVFGMYAAYLATWAIDCSLREPARRTHFRRLFADLYSGRLSILRLLAVPTDVEFGDAIGPARRSMALNSGPEQQLMLLQATLNNRPDRAARLLRELGVPDAVQPPSMTLAEAVA